MVLSNGATIKKSAFYLWSYRFSRSRLPSAILIQERDLSSLLAARKWLKPFSHPESHLKRTFIWLLTTRITWILHENGERRGKIGVAMKVGMSRGCWKNIEKSWRHQNQRHSVTANLAVLDWACLWFRSFSSPYGTITNVGDHSTSKTTALAL